MGKKPSNYLQNWESAAPSALHANVTTPEAAEEFDKASSGLFSVNLVKFWKDFKLIISFKNLVNFCSTRRLARASATTTTAYTTTKCCRSAASELSEAHLTGFEA